MKSGDYWKLFRGKRVLLLQGPVGPFFTSVGKALMNAGAAKVVKVNFNGGDWFFSPRGSVNFDGTLAQWPDFLARLVEYERIDTFMAYGDCRPVHQAAMAVAEAYGIRTWVFEEGYVRPNYVTFEVHGVNANSRLPSDPAFYADLHEFPDSPEHEVGPTFGLAAKWAMLYYTFGTLGFPWFSPGVHHRSLNMLEGLLWVRSFWRKHWYGFKQRRVLPALQGRHDRRFFLVPLQVAGDSQIKSHSKYASVTDFLREVVESFAAHAPADTVLAVKHHPLDRGYTDYSRLLRRLARAHGLQGRLLYLHDQHLPTLLDHACGVVVVNSTVGMQALHHQTPLKAMGRAIYDMRGLTFQGSLDAFWTEAPAHTPDINLYRKFRTYVIEHTQLNGSFYKPLPVDDVAGMRPTTTRAGGGTQPGFTPSTFARHI